MSFKTNTGTLDESKKQFRMHFRSLRDSIIKKEKYSIMLSENFFKSIVLSKATIISSYMPINSEIDVSFLTKELISLGHIVVMPTEDKQNDTLIFQKCSFINEKWQIHDKTYEPEILIIPMLAFDKKLMRLGYGKGWYDKTIKKFKNRNEKLLVGVAYSLQFSREKLPCDDFDQILDIIITENDVYGFS